MQGLSVSGKCHSEETGEAGPGLGDDPAAPVGFPRRLAVGGRREGKSQDFAGDRGNGGLQRLSGSRRPEAGDEQQAAEKDGALVGVGAEGRPLS
jgi:hypothetical protein